MPILQGNYLGFPCNALGPIVCCIFYIYIYIGLTICTHTNLYVCISIYTYLVVQGSGALFASVLRCAASLSRKAADSSLKSMAFLRLVPKAGKKPNMSRPPLTLCQTKMEPEKGSFVDYRPLQMGPLLQFHSSLGECTTSQTIPRSPKPVQAQPFQGCGFCSLQRTSLHPKAPSTIIVHT